MTRNAIGILPLVIAFAIALSPHPALGQFNSGSNGQDGAFNPASSVNIDMVDHPNGIYQYTSVNIPSGVTVYFTPNPSNTPVVWLVQSNCTISGTVNVNGAGSSTFSGGLGGPGGYRGGSGGSQATPGQGPGGGPVGLNYGGNASYGAPGGTNSNAPIAGPTYGSTFLLPLLGGSGGGGSGSLGGGGGGGALLIAAAGLIQVNGLITANGGGGGNYGYGGGGSGGAIRLAAAKITGGGSLSGYGGNGGGYGRIRFDTYENDFGGGMGGVFSQGTQPILSQSPGQGTQLTIESIGGVSVSSPPSGALATPDAVLSAQQPSPTPVVVRCSNLPLNSQITVSLKPMTGSPISVVGSNSSGTQSSSTATVLVNIPRGGGLIYATATTSN